MIVEAYYWNKYLSVAMMALRICSIKLNHYYLIKITIIVHNVCNYICMYLFTKFYHSSMLTIFAYICILTNEIK